MLSILLDIEWLLSTLFDASLLTFEPPETAASFYLRKLSRFEQAHHNTSGRQAGAVTPSPVKTRASSVIVRAFPTRRPWNLTTH